MVSDNIKLEVFLPGLNLFPHLQSANWPEPWKYLTYPDPSLNIEVQGETVTLSCALPIKGIVLDVEGEPCDWSDQAIDLMPGDPQTLTAKGLKGRKIKARVSLVNARRWLKRDR